MVKDEKKPALLLLMITLVAVISVLMYSVFDSPKYNPVNTELITSATIVHATTVLSDEKININTASAEELTKLKFIGEKKAELIVEYRELNGPFRTPDELKAISGITQNIIDANAGRIAVQ